MIKQHIKKKRKMNCATNKIVIAIICLSWIFSACKNNETNNSLPYIGKHDIVLFSGEGYTEGDTIYHKTPAFSYLTQNNDTLHSSDIEGKVWIVKFFFTTCPTICPPMTNAMKLVTEKLQNFDYDLVYLSFSIDPKKDTVEQLRNYINEHNIQNENWYFLTGDEDETHDLGVNGFYIHAQSDDLAPGGFAHSPNFILVDQNLHIRGLYNGLIEEERNQLISDTKRLLQ